MYIPMRGRERSLLRISIIAGWWRAGSTRLAPSMREAEQAVGGGMVGR